MDGYYLVAPMWCLYILQQLVQCTKIYNTREMPADQHSGNTGSIHLYWVRRPSVAVFVTLAIILDANDLVNKSISSYAA